VEIVSEHGLAAMAGAFGGILLGLAARMSRFCTLGAIEDALYGGSLVRVRMWALALGTAIAGVFALDAAGLVAIDASIYAARAWNPVASLVGGLLFGYGMAISGTCGYGSLARLGGGDMRAFVIVVVMGVAAYATISGPLAPIRLWLFPAAEGAAGLSGFGLAHALQAYAGIPAIAVAAAISLGLAIWALADPGSRSDPAGALWAGVVGLAIVSGWVATTWIAETGFEVIQVESHSFTAPVGESMLWLMTSSGGGAGFAIGSVAGVIVGSALGCAIKGHFRWEACDDARELGRQIGGGALMGVGAVVAVGCSVGQGLTAFSTLAFSAPVVLAAIFVGAAVGLRQLIRGFSTA